MVDPYSAAAGAWLNPDDPGYRVAMRELQEADVLREVPYDTVSATIMGRNPQYEVTPEGAGRIRGV